MEKITIVFILLTIIFLVGFYINSSLLKAEQNYLQDSLKKLNDDLDKQKNDYQEEFKSIMQGVGPSSKKTSVKEKTGTSDGMPIFNN